MSESIMLPQDQDCERSLVACGMLNSNLLDDIFQTIRPEMILETAAREVLALMQEMHGARKSIDTVSLQRELKARKKFDLIGGPAYLVKLMEIVPHTAHWNYYADAVRNDWIRREALFAGEAIVRTMSDRGKSPAEAIGEADRRMVELVESLDAGSKDVVGISEVLCDLQDLWSSGEEANKGIPTHSIELNKLVGGFAPGNMVIVAARPSVGKTALAMNLIATWAKKSIPGLFVSAEQSKIEIAERLLAIHTCASIDDMREGNVDHIRMEASRSEMAAWPVHIDDRGNPSILQVESVARRFKRLFDIQYIVVDYLQLIQPSDQKIPREQQIADNSRRFKALAKSLEIPVIVLAQLNRQSEARDTKRPRLSDLRESGSIEQDADKVLLLWRQFMDNPDATEEQQKEAVAIVAKNRQGPVGDAKMVYFGDQFRFTDRFGGSSTEMVSQSLSGPFKW